MTKYIKCADTAKLIRKALKANFKGIKFSVRSSSYAGGASIRISWTDGPTQKQVQEIAHKFESSGFDGMIDYKYSKSHWLMPDGKILLRHNEGSSDCGGCVQGVENDCPHPEAQAVRFGADFVFCERSLSIEAKNQIVPIIEKKWGLPQPLILNEHGHVQDNWHHKNADCWIGQLMHRESVDLSFPLKTEGAE